MEPVFRAPMHPRDRDEPAAGYGLAHDLVGIGDADPGRRERFAAAPDGAFVWTRDADGAFWLGRLAGPARRARGAAAAAAGITDERPVRWQERPVPHDEVPEAVLATYGRGGRNFQRTHDAGIERRSAAIWRDGGAG